MDKKYTFEIPVEWAMYSSITVEASTYDEALKIAKEGNLPSADESSYVDGSFEINIDASDDMNEHVIETIKVDQTPLKELPLLVDSLETEVGKDRLQERLTEEG